MWLFLHSPPKHRFRHTANYWCLVKVFSCLFPKKSKQSVLGEIIMKYPLKHPPFVRFAHESVGFINY